MDEFNQKHVIESVTQFLEKVKNIKANYKLVNVKNDHQTLDFVGVCSM